ncbi:integrase, catalytic region, zinc finger, CCHC-type containing protein, partial [Tanacetum coccineum]
NQALGARVINLVGNAGVNQLRVIRCYNCNGEGHIAKQCTAKKRVKDSKWFKDKMLLAQAQEAGLQATTNFKSDHVDAYDSDCNDEATANAIFMANLSLVVSINDDMVEPHYDSDILSELTSNSNVISYTNYMLTIGNNDDNYVPPLVQKNDMMLSVIEKMKSQVEKCNMVNQET